VDISCATKFDFQNFRDLSTKRTVLIS